MKFKIRNDIEPLQIQGNNCTVAISIHPVTNYVVSLLDKSEPDDSYRASLILLNKRQKWNCYYYDLGEHGWDCTRDNVTLRLSEEDFIRAFGKITVLSKYDGKPGNHPRYHEESDGAFIRIGGVDYVKKEDRHNTVR